MTRNQDLQSAWRYHELTDHSYWSVRTTPHYLDWHNKPSPFKIYPALEAIPLPKEFAMTGAPALEAIASSGIEPAGEQRLRLDQLASLLLYSAGVTKQKTFPGGEIFYRAAACAGALYPVELYIVCGELDGLAAGVYHFNPGDFALRQLRTGDLRGALAQASGNETRVQSAPVTLIYSALSWRSTWKYRDRAYRYHYWDSGMIAANTLAMAAAHRLPAEVVMGFVEADVNKLIGIDGENELALNLIALGHSDVPLPIGPTIDELPVLNYDVIPLSADQVDYPAIREMHAASSLASADEVRDWRTALLAVPTSAATRSVIPLAPMPTEDLPAMTIEATIERRASTRRFAHRSIRYCELSEMLERATRGISTDLPVTRDEQLNDIYLIVNDVEGLAPGAYVYRHKEHALELLKGGDFRERASYLTLEQDLGGDASVTVFFMTDLQKVFAAYGNRGYRAAQMEAAITGGRMYLAAYALKRGATGLTFYDQDVTEFFSPHAADKNCIFVVSIGVPGKRPVY